MSARLTAPSSTADAAIRDDDRPLLELVGFAAHVRLRLFAMLGRHIDGAPDLPTALRLYAVAMTVGEQIRAFQAIGLARGVDPVELALPFAELLRTYGEHTPETSWWEGLLIGVVGHGTSGDMCRLLARGLPADDCAAVLDTLSQEVDEEDRVSVFIRNAGESDPKLRSLLALWGRRLVGESLQTAQKLLLSRPCLGELARRASGTLAPEPVADPLAWALGELTAEHTRRMDRMGLPA
jgi:hypothetical protein